MIIFVLKCDNTRSKKTLYLLINNLCFITIIAFFWEPVISGNIQIQTSLGGSNWATITTTNVGVANKSLEAELSPQSSIKADFIIENLPPPQLGLANQYAVSVLSNNNR